jgi:adenylate cyclase
VLAKAIAVLALLGYTACAFFLFNSHNLVLPLALPLVSAFSTSFGALIWQVVEEQKQKGRIKGMFATYLAPAVVSRLIDSGKEPELGGHDSEITAYFSDIQGFSSFSEVMSSQKLGELLNEFLSACTDIVTAEGGTLDKYIGDAVVAIFGAPIEAPDHAYRACVTSQLIQAKVAELRTKWTGEGEKWPTLVHELRTRIGLNTGVCMIGNFGSNTRFSYTMMGDNVNTAARMESGAKSWGVYTMVTDATKLACEKFGDRVVFRPLGKIVVKGRSQPVPIHEIVGLKESLPEGATACINLFKTGLERFYAQDWDGAEKIFRECSLLEINRPKVTVGVKTNPSLVYLEIIEEFRAEPPGPNWDGSYVMKEK